MNNYLLFNMLLITISMLSMNEAPLSEIVVHSDNRLRVSDPTSEMDSEHEEEKLSRMAVDIYFENPHERLANEIMPRVKHKISLLKEESSEEEARIHHELKSFRRMIRSSPHAVAPSPTVNKYIFNVVNESIKEAFAQAEEERIAIQKQANLEARNKRVAIICGTVSTCLTLLTSIILQVTKPGC